MQSSYIPWKGYFDLIRAADEFILLDDVQFTKRDWRSRNRIKTKDGLSWLTIPVHSKGRFEQRIMDTTISDPSWAERHWQTIQGAYARAPFFETYAPHVRALYEQAAVGSTERRQSLVDRRPRAGSSRSRRRSHGRQNITRVKDATSGSSTSA